MKNTSDTQKILSAIKGLENEVGNRIDRLEKSQHEMHVEMREGLTDLAGAVQGLADHMDLRFDEFGERVTGLFRLSDRKTNDLIYALAKKKIFTRIEANALAASGPAL